MNYNLFEACHNLVAGPNGSILAPDECLGSRLNHVVPIPLLTRDELQGRLPSVDTKVLHYFFTQLILQRYPYLIKSFDETSLITLAWLMEKWVRDYLVLPETQQISPGVAEQTGKNINYRYSPADI